MTAVEPRDDIGSGAAAAPGEVRRWRAFSLLAAACFMTAVDLLIVNVALPTIGAKLHFAESDLQWVAAIPLRSPVPRAARPWTFP